MNKGLLQQKSVMLLTGAIVVAIVVFWFAAYKPKQKLMQSLKTELSAAQREINTVQELIAFKGDINQAVNYFNKRIRELEDKLPDQEETTLRELARKAVKMDLEVISVNPQEPVKTELPVDVPGCVCEELVINMVIRGHYKDVGDYIGLLEGEFQSLITLQKIELTKIEAKTDKKDKKEEDTRLIVTMQIVLYLLMPA